MKISYAITVCNELDEVTKLLNFLIQKKRKQDEIVVLFDIGSGTAEVWDRLQDLKERMRHTKASKLVQYAITKEYEMKKIVVPGNIDGLKKAVAKGTKATADFFHGLGITMGNTEALLRSTTFIIGVQRHWDAEHFVNSRGNNKIPWWDFQKTLNKKREELVAFTGSNDDRMLLENQIESLEEDIQLALYIGREFSYFSNFGLSTQDVGKFNWNGLGNMFGKFKYWSQQKFGRDIRIFQEAIIGLSRLSKLDKGTV